MAGQVEEKERKKEEKKGKNCRPLAIDDDDGGSWKSGAKVNSLFPLTQCIWQPNNDNCFSAQCTTLTWDKKTDILTLHKSDVYYYYNSQEFALTFWILAV